MPPLRAELLSVGTELLLGEIVDTNAAYLARRLAAIGIDCFHISQVGDNLARVHEAIDTALARSDILVTTGGLGPTEDDLTREAIAAALSETPTVDAALEAGLRGYFAQRGLAMPERNRKQAWLIPSARSLPNPNGTAPGWWASRDGRDIIAMPGVPREMTAMWEDHVEPVLATRAGAHLVIRVLKVIGLGESAVEQLLGELVRSSFPTVATYAKADGVHVRIAAKAPSREEAEAVVARVEAEARLRLGEHVWGGDRDVLREVVGAALAERGWRLAVRETFTVGAVAAALCDAGVPDWFAGAAIGGARAPDAEVLLSIDAADGVARIEVRSPEGTREAEVRFDAVAEGKRRATLVALDLVRRALGARV